MDSSFDDAGLKPLFLDLTLDELVQKAFHTYLIAEFADLNLTVKYPVNKAV